MVNYLRHTLTPTFTHSTRAWIIDTNAEEHMPPSPTTHTPTHTHKHTSMFVLVHEHTHRHIYHSTLCLSYLIHFHPNSAVFTHTHCLQNLLQATSIQPLQNHLLLTSIFTSLQIIWSFLQIICLSHKGATQDVLRPCQPVLIPAVKALHTFGFSHSIKQLKCVNRDSPLHCFSVFTGSQILTLCQTDMQVFERSLIISCNFECVEVWHPYWRAETWHIFYTTTEKFGVT